MVLKTESELSPEASFVTMCGDVVDNINHKQFKDEPRGRPCLHCTRRYQSHRWEDRRRERIDMHRELRVMMRGNS